MKQIAVVILCSIISCSLFAQSKTDSIAIREAALNYIEGFYTNNFQRMEKAIHPELAKRIVAKDSIGNFQLRNMGSSELIYNTKKFKRSPESSNTPFEAKVIIYDIAYDISSVKVSQNKMKFFDYLQLGKINGEWKIINVLWARTE